MRFHQCGIRQSTQCVEQGMYWTWIPPLIKYAISSGYKIGCQATSDIQSSKMYAQFILWQPRFLRTVYRARNKTILHRWREARGKNNARRWFFSIYLQPMPTPVLQDCFSLASAWELCVCIYCTASRRYEEPYTRRGFETTKRRAIQHHTAAVMLPNQFWNLLYVINAVKEKARNHFESKIEIFAV